MTQFTNAVTHSGDMHPDDVMAGGFLKETNPGIRFVRTRDKTVLEAAMSDDDTVVYDVGFVYDESRNCYDHHQRQNAPNPRPNGVPFSSFGLLWQRFGLSYCERLVAKYGKDIDPAQLHELIDHELVQGIDVIDTGAVDNPRFQPKVGEVSVEVKTFALALFELAPQPLLFEIPPYDEAYNQATDIAAVFLNRFAEACLAKLCGRQLLVTGRRVEECVVVSPKVIPDWSDVVSAEFPETLYYLEPDTNDQTGKAYMLWQVPVEPRGFVGRKSLPESWAGKRGTDLVAVTGIEGSGFCHVGCFVGGGETLEATLAMAKAAIAA
ncbi:MAG: MYG1 family protein [Candidatus Magasanikbacteria bacterium]